MSTNCYLAYSKISRKGILIDPAVYDEEVAGYIADSGIDVKYTVNTHGHADHIAGNAAFSYPVLIHELDEPCLRDPIASLAFSAEVEVERSEAARFLCDGDVVDVDGLCFEAIFTPGHSPGGICLRCGSVLFSGDTLFYEGIGRSDLPGGDHETLIRSIKEKLMILPDDVVVYPGHGPETTIGHERRFNPFLG